MGTPVFVLPTCHLSRQPRPGARRRAPRPCLGFLEARTPAHGSIRGLVAAALVSCLVAADVGSAQGADPCAPQFENLPIFPIAPNFGTSALADFDGDGHLDLSIGFVFHLGDGAGAFGSGIAVAPTEAAPWPETVGFDIKTGDFDGDEILDAAVVQFGADRVWMLWGERSGERMPFFESPRAVSFDGISRSVWHIDRADFDGDGRLDLVGVDRGESTHVILRNLGAREFEVSPLRSLRKGAHMLATGDFDGDGRTDLVIGRRSETSLWFGNGDGTFGVERSGTLSSEGRAASGHRFRAVDLDADGRAELIATAERHVFVYDGREFSPAHGTPVEPAAKLLTAGGARFIEAADVNRDGVLDVVSVAEVGARSDWNVFLGDGATDPELSFVRSSSGSTGLSGHGSVLAVGDADEDGAPDLVITTEDTNSARVILNLDVCVEVRTARGDANRDGSVDVSDPISALRHLFVGETAPCAKAAEVNGDGRLDLSDPIYLLARLFLGGPALVGGNVTDCGG
jgi:hypothetical protein